MDGHAQCIICSNVAHYGWGVVDATYSAVVGPSAGGYDALARNLTLRAQVTDHGIVPKGPASEVYCGLCLHAVRCLLSGVVCCIILVYSGVL